MKKLASVVLFGAIATGAVGCEALHEGMEGHKTVVARVDGFSLKIEHAAELLAAATSRVAPAVPIVVDPLTDLWIGYTLLASELASADSLDDVDLTPPAQFSSDQELVWNLHRGTILARAEPSESELRESYEREQPMTVVEGQHILIRVPESATSSQQDSLRRHAQGIWERAMSGEPFEELARTFSEDPTTASRGGWLGPIRRGRLVPEIEAVVFALEPGVVSETVRSRFGYHIIKVTKRDSPEFDDVRDEYRGTVLDRRMDEIEAIYMDSLFDAADLRFAPGLATLTGQLASSEKLQRLSPAERSATLVRFRGGSLRVGELADFLMRVGPNTRAMFASGDSAQVRELLREMVRNKLLVSAAESQGYSLTESQVDSLRKDSQRELYVAATVAGFRRQELLRGEDAITAEVDRALKEVLARESSPRPVEKVAPALRRGRAIQVYPHRFPAVVARLIEIREAQAQGNDGDAPGEQPKR